MLVDTHLISLRIPDVLLDRMRATLRESTERVAIAHPEPISAGNDTVLVVRGMDVLPVRAILEEVCERPRVVMRGVSGPAMGRGDAIQRRELRRRVPSDAHSVEIELLDTIQGLRSFWWQGRQPLDEMTECIAVPSLRPVAKPIVAEISRRSPSDVVLPRTAALLGSSNAEQVWRALRFSVIGAGRLGSLTASALASQGIRDMVIVDGDHLEPGNLDGTELFRRNDIARAKASSLAERLTDRFPEGSFRAVPRFLGARGVLPEVLGSHVIVSVVDRPVARYLAASIAARTAQLLLDIGTGPGDSDAFGTEVRLVVPGSRCLGCAGGVARQPDMPGRSSRGINALAAHVGVQTLIHAIAHPAGMETTWLQARLGARGGVSCLARPVVSLGSCPSCGELSLERRAERKLSSETSD